MPTVNTSQGGLEGKEGDHGSRKNSRMDHFQCSRPWDLTSRGYIPASFPGRELLHDPVATPKARFPFSSADMAAPHPFTLLYLRALRGRPASLESQAGKEGTRRKNS